MHHQHHTGHVLVIMVLIWPGLISTLKVNDGIIMGGTIYMAELSYRQRENVPFCLTGGIERSNIV